MRFVKQNQINSRQNVMSFTVSPQVAPEIFSIAELFAEKGQAFAIEDSKPILLNDPNIVWLVEQGEVLLFAVQLEDGQPADIRHFIAKITPGQALFGLNSSNAEGLNLIALVMAGSSLIRLDISHLLEATTNLAIQPELINLVDNWLNCLSTDLTTDFILPHQQIVVDAHIKQTIEEDLIIIPRNGTLWVQLISGRSLFLGEESFDAQVESSEASNWFPLHVGTWLYTLEKCQVLTYNTGTALQQPESWQGFLNFGKLFLNIKATNLKLGMYDEINRLHQKAEYDKFLNYTAISNLSGVMGKSKPAVVRKNKDHQGLLLEACKLVGQAQNIKIVAPANVEIQEHAWQQDYLQQIAQTSLVRVRKVLLPSNWWRKDSGPLLAFTPTPVALLPISGHAYELIDPRDGSQVRVTEKVASDIEDYAFTFYRAFPYKVLNAWDLLRFSFYSCYRDVATMLTLSVLSGILGLLLPLVTGYIMDAVIPTSARFVLLEMLGALIVVSVTSISFSLTRSMTLLRLETKIESAFEAALLDRLLGLKASFFREYSIGDLVNRVGGISTIRQTLSSGVLTAILGSLSSLFSFFLLFNYDLRLALIAFGLTLINIIFTVVIGLVQLHYQRNQLEVQGKLSGLVFQLITGISKLRVAGAEMGAFSVWATKFAEQRRLSFKSRSVNNLTLVFVGVWPVFTMLTIFISLEMFKNEGLSTGKFLAFNAAFGQFQAGMLSLVSSFMSLIQIVPLYERAKGVLEALPEVSHDKQNPGYLDGSIEISHVSFRYAEEKPLVINDISLEVKAGQFIAIVGASGSGKSTLLRLLLGFEIPEGGSIYYSNQDLATLNLQQVRRQIGVVTQNGKLNAGSIFQNIVGSLPLSHEKAWEAAYQVGLANDISEMPMGMFTYLAEGGSTLSGGQRQRLLIARAIVDKPHILLFDEATSALDNRTQEIVSQSLEQLQVTRIVIAHRLSTIAKADCIYVLQNGKFVQFGSYEALISQEGPFRELAMRQIM